MGTLSDALKELQNTLPNIIKTEIVHASEPQLRERVTSEMTTRYPDCRLTILGVEWKELTARYTFEIQHPDNTIEQDVIEIIARFTG